MAAYKMAAVKVTPTPTGNRSPDRPARSESLYLLSYPGTLNVERRIKSVVKLWRRRVKGWRYSELLIHDVFTPDMKTLNTRTRRSWATERTMLPHICEAIYLSDVSWWGSPQRQSRICRLYLLLRMKMRHTDATLRHPKCFRVFFCAKHEKWTRGNLWASVFIGSNKCTILIQQLSRVCH
jgi:hypothetical protein